MKVIWSPEAERGREAQLDFYAEFNPGAANRMNDAIYADTELLGHFPRMGHEGRVTGTREWHVKGTPFLLIYKVDDAVRILRLLHKAQQWPGQYLQ